jgi:hypothetical protein
MTHITAKDAHSFLSRWALVREMEEAELRRSSMDVKARQLAVLMASHELFSRDRMRDQELTRVRERWATIRRALSG